MKYRIESSFNGFSAIEVDEIPSAGTCVEIKGFNTQKVSLIIYSDGRLKDINLNGWVFPFAYNNLDSRSGSDIFGGKHRINATFQVIDKNGDIQDILDKTIYGDKEAAAVEYFYTMIYNISLCKDINQFSDLYKYVIDNDLRYHHAKPIKVLAFIDDFAKYIDTITDANTQGIRLLLKKHYEVNKKLISDSEFPV